MRIPHRSHVCLSVRLVALTVLSGFVVLLPICARAATPELTCLPAWKNFGAGPIHGSHTQLLELKDSGATSTTISSINASPSNFQVSGVILPLPPVFAAGPGAGIAVTFSPTASKWVRGSITLTSEATNSALQVSVRDGGVFKQDLEAQPGSIAFGQVPVGSSVSQSVVVTSTFSGNEYVKGFKVSGTGFSVSGPATPVALSTGQSFTLTVKFSPQAAGLVSGNVNVRISGTGLNIPLTGSGIAAASGQLSVSPSALSLGSVWVGSSGTASGSLNASGASVTVTADSVNNSAFTVSGLSLPVTLAPGQSVPFTVKFTPTAAGSASATLAFTSNAQAATTDESLTGTGTSAPGQLAVSPTSLSLGSVAVGSSGTASGSLSASGASVTVTADSVNNSAFTVSGLSLPVTLAAGQSVPFTVNFTPTAAGVASATLAFTSNAQTATTSESLTGTGTSPVGQLAVSPTILSLGSIVVGSSGTASGSLSASGAAVTVTADKISNSAFTVSGVALPVTIPAGQSVAFTVKFTPTAAGSASGTLAFTSNAQTSTSESLTGTGTAAPGQLAMSPSTLSFGNVNVGTTATQATTLAASGASVTISSAAMSNSLFKLSGASFPMTLNAGQSQQIYVLFSPSASGTDSGTLTLNSNASNSQMSESLSGVGVTPQYSVSLTWNASTSSVVGYNIYRGTSPGAYSKINATVDPNTTYTDSTVTAGATYYYAATAVNPSGEESGYSTPVEVTIP